MKSIIDQMNNCVHVWKSRNLTYSGKTLIVLKLWEFQKNIKKK